MMRISPSLHEKKTVRPPDIGKIVVAIGVVLLSVLFCCSGDRQPTVSIHFTVWQWNSFVAPHSKINTFVIELHEGDSFGPTTVASGSRDSTFRVGQIVNDTTVRIYLDNSLIFIRGYDKADRSVQDSILVTLNDVRFRTKSVDGGYDYLIRIDTTYEVKGGRVADSVPRFVEVTEQDAPRSWTWVEEDLWGDGKLRARCGFAFNDEWMPVWHGLWQVFAHTGQMTREMEYDYGTPSGRFVEWYTNGVKKTEGQHLKVMETRLGYRHGEWKFWDEDGRLCGIGQYDSGRGETHMWHRDSSVMAVEYYKNGERDSIWQEWYENGQLKQQSVFGEGGKGILMKLYAPDGRLEYTSEGKRGRQPARDWYLNGQMKKEDGKKLCREWYADGQKKIQYDKKEFTFGNSSSYAPHGRHTEWYQNGKVKVRGQRAEGSPAGIWTEYDTTGTMTATSDYQKEGGLIRTNFYPDGTIESTGKCGGREPDVLAKSGPWKYFDKEGNPIREEEWEHGMLIYVDGKRYIP